MGTLGRQDRNAGEGGHVGVKRGEWKRDRERDVDELVGEMVGRMLPGVGVRVSPAWVDGHVHMSVAMATKLRFPYGSLVFNTHRKFGTCVSYVLNCLDHFKTRGGSKQMGLEMHGG